MKKRILFVDDEPNILRGLQRMLRSMRREWDMRFAETGPEALEIMEREHFDVIVSDMRMPGMDGVQLLEEVKKKYPETVRIVLSGHSDSQMTMKAVRVAHQYISKPAEAEELKSKISRSCSLLSLLNSASLVKVVSGLEKLPTLPQVYQQVMEELQQEDPSIGKVGAVIARAPTMAAKVLQLVNSSFFGIPRHIESPVQAVNLLGLDTLKSLVLAVEVFSAFDPKKISARVLDRIWKHSVQTGTMARVLAQEEAFAKDGVDDAAMAGLLHDLGKLILMDNFSGAYKNVVSKVQETGFQVHEAENEIFGVSHAEVGAYLLGLWGLPQGIVEAVAFHHLPDQCPLDQASPLLAVHVANALSKSESKGRTEDLLTLGLDQACLKKIGLQDRIEQWMEIGHETLNTEEAEP